MLLSSAAHAVAAVCRYLACAAGVLITCVRCTPPSLLQASFRQWQVERSVPQLEQEVAAATAARDAVVVEQEEQVRRM